MFLGLYFYLKMNQFLNLWLKFLYVRLYDMCWQSNILHRDEKRQIEKQDEVKKMSNTYENNKQMNPLGVEPIGKLLRKFAVPSIISMVVMSLYNIVDQIFIGQTVGELGNAATNVAFPLTTLCIATALTFGIGGASGFNLNLGAGDEEKAPYFIGNGMVMMSWNRRRFIGHCQCGNETTAVVFWLHGKYTAFCHRIYKNYCNRISGSHSFFRWSTFNQSGRKSKILYDL